MRHLGSDLHCWVVWSSLQQFRHWVTGGLSWKARTEQCLPKAARNFCLRILRAASSSVVANTREDLGVVVSSSSALSHLGFAARESWSWAYCGLQARSSSCTASALRRIWWLVMEMEDVLTASICILNHFLSSRSWTSLKSPRLFSTGRMASWNLRRSLALWSALVEMMRFPCVLKLAATTLR